MLDEIEYYFQVDVIFTHFSKAFDSIDHRIPLGELSITIFGEPILSCLSTCLIEVQWVKICDYNSALVTVILVVPQGGNLSPSEDPDITFFYVCV